MSTSASQFVGKWKVTSSPNVNLSQMANGQKFKIEQYQDSGQLQLHLIDRKYGTNKDWNDTILTFEDGYLTCSFQGEPPWVFAILSPPQGSMMAAHAISHADESGGGWTAEDDGG